MGPTNPSAGSALTLSGPGPERTLKEELSQGASCQGTQSSLAGPQVNNSEATVCVSNSYGWQMVGVRCVSLKGTGKNEGRL